MTSLRCPYCVGYRGDKPSLYKHLRNYHTYDELAKHLFELIAEKQEDIGSTIDKVQAKYDKINDEFIARSELGGKQEEEKTIPVSKIEEKIKELETSYLVQEPMIPEMVKQNPVMQGAINQALLKFCKSLLPK